MRPLDRHIREDLNRRLTLIGTQLGADVVTIVSPILPGLELRLRDAIDALPERQGSVVAILDTPGGVVEVVERMVTALRAIYTHVTCDRA